MMNQSQFDCIIVGGGIGGAILALALGRSGKQVLIVEKELEPPAAGRPEVLADSAVEIFNRLGIGERFLKEAALPLKGLQLWHSETRNLILSIDEADLHRTHFHPYSTNPNVTRQIILEAAQNYPSVRMRCGIQIEGLLREGGRVVGIKGTSAGNAIQWYSKLVVGDDGGHSKVRSSMSIELKLREFPLIFLAASGSLLPGQSENIGQVWLDPKKIKSGLFGGIFMPQPNRRSAFVFLMSPKTYEFFSSTASSEFFKAARNLSPLCKEMEKSYRFPNDFHLFKRPFGHSPKYVAEGAVLIGDAAHPVTPAGGQGANASVADAISLAEQVKADLGREEISMECLRAYERERWLANQRSVQISVRADFIFRLLGAFPFLAPILVAFLKYVNRDISLKDRFLRTISQSFRSNSI